MEDILGFLGSAIVIGICGFAGLYILSHVILIIIRIFEFFRGE